MTVNTFEPSQDILIITDQAAIHFSKQLKKADLNAIRVSLKESGCTGYKYVIDEVESAQDNDIPMRLDNGVQVYIDPQHVAAFRGTTIDYVQKGLNQELVLNNPNVADACGCGESFNFQ